MTSPLLALRAAILTRLAGDAALAALMGGVVRLYDEPPAGASPVYAVFGNGSVRDDSADGAERHVHALDLTVIGKPGSTRSALDAAERIAARLRAVPPALDGHALVLLRVVRITADRDERTGEIRAVLGLEAVTETVPAP